MFVGVPWNPRGIITDSPGGIRKRYITRALGYERMARQTVAQPAKVMHKSMCQGVENDLKTSSTKRNSQVNHVLWSNKKSSVVRLKRSYQVISVCKWSKNNNNNNNNNMHQSSSSHEEPMQVNTTPRRARIPEDESDTRTVRPRLDMSVLISELCERDVPEIDWERLAMDNKSVYDIYTGLKLDEEQVRAGRETEVKRMLEFEVCEEVNEEQARGKRIWNSAWLDSQKRPGLARSRLVVNQVRGASKHEDVCGHTTTCSDAFHFVSCCIAWSWPLPRLVGCVCSILPRSD